MGGAAGLLKWIFGASDFVARMKIAFRAVRMAKEGQVGAGAEGVGRDDADLLVRSSP